MTGVIPETKKLPAPPTHGELKAAAGAGIIVPGEQHSVTSFYAASEVEYALQNARFDLHEEMTILMRHIRDPDPKTSLAALRQFRMILKEVAVLSGMMGRVKQTEMERDGSVTTTREIATETLLGRMEAHNNAAQSKELPDHERYPSTVDGSEEGSDPDPPGDVTK